MICSCFKAINYKIITGPSNIVTIESDEELNSSLNKVQGKFMNFTIYLYILRKPAKPTASFWGTYIDFGNLFQMIACQQFSTLLQFGVDLVRFLFYLWTSVIHVSCTWLDLVQTSLFWHGTCRWYLSYRLTLYIIKKGRKKWTDFFPSISYISQNQQFLTLSITNIYNGRAFICICWCEWFMWKLHKHNDLVVVVVFAVTLRVVHYHVFI